MKLNNFILLNIQLYSQVPVMITLSKTILKQPFESTNQTGPLDHNIIGT